MQMFATEKHFDLFFWKWVFCADSDRKCRIWWQHCENYQFTTSNVGWLFRKQHFNDRNELKMAINIILPYYCLSAETFPASVCTCIQLSWFWDSKDHWDFCRHCLHSGWEQPSPEFRTLQPQPYLNQHSAESYSWHVDTHDFVWECELPKISLNKHHPVESSEQTTKAYAQDIVY